MVLEGRVWSLPGPVVSEGGRSSLRGLLSPLNQPPPERGREGGREEGREGGREEGREGGREGRKEGKKWKEGLSRKGEG